MTAPVDAPTRRPRRGLDIVVRIASIVGWIGLVVIVAWAGVAGRAWAWSATAPIRFRGDVANALRVGHSVNDDALRLATSRPTTRPDAAPPWRDLIAAYLARYDRSYDAAEQAVVAEERAKHRPASDDDSPADRRFDIDYPPGRLAIATAWAHHERAIGAPTPREYRDELVAPLLRANMATEALFAIGTLALVRRVLRDANRSRARATWLATLAAALAWLNPAVIVDAHAWPQWDAWVLPFVTWAAYAAACGRWASVGALLAVGAMFKGQLLIVAPMFLAWPIALGDGRATLRLLAGFALTAAAIASPWLLASVEARRWTIGVAIAAILALARTTWRARRALADDRSDRTAVGLSVVDDKLTCDESITLAGAPALDDAPALHDAPSNDRSDRTAVGLSVAPDEALTSNELVARDESIVGNDARTRDYQADRCAVGSSLERSSLVRVARRSIANVGAYRRLIEATLAALGVAWIVAPFLLPDARGLLWPATAIAAAVLATAFVRRGRVALAGVALAAAIFIAGARFGGSYAWLRVGFPSDRYPLMWLGRVSNLPTILAIRYDLNVHTAVRWFGSPIELRSLLRGTCLAGLLVLGIAAARARQRRDANLLVALPAAWLLIYALLPQMHERYLMWAAATSAALAARSVGGLIAHVAITAIASAMILLPMMEVSRAATRPGYQPWADAMSRAIPDVGWAVATLAVTLLVWACTAVGGRHARFGRPAASLRRFVARCRCPKYANADARPERSARPQIETERETGWPSLAWRRS